MRRDGRSAPASRKSDINRRAQQFDRSPDGAIRDVADTAENGRIAIAADTDPERDPTVPIWAARRNADLLAEALGREVEIAA